MSTVKEKPFIVVLGCIDGRTIVPLVEWLTRKFPGYNIDLITEPGVDALLSKKKRWIFGFIIRWLIYHYTLAKIKVSIKLHASEYIILVGHCGFNGTKGCAANVGSAEEHKQDLRKAGSLLHTRFNKPTKTLLIKTGAAFIEEVSVVGVVKLSTETPKVASAFANSESN